MPVDALSTHKTFLNCFPGTILWIPFYFFFPVSIQNKHIELTLCYIHKQAKEEEGRHHKTNTSQTNSIHSLVWLFFILPFELRTQILADIENVPTQLLTKKITHAQFIVCFKSRIGIITFPLSYQYFIVLYNVLSC